MAPINMAHVPTIKDSLNEFANDAISSFMDYKNQNGGYTGFSWFEAEQIFKQAYLMRHYGQEADAIDWASVMEEAIEQTNN